MKIETWGALHTVLAPSLEIAARGSVANVLAVLVAEYPDFAQHAERTACAVGDELVPRSYQLQPGDTLVLIPPVAGG